MTAPATTRSRPPGLLPWARVAFAMFAVGWGANQFASLLLAYRHREGLSAAVTNGLFGVYAAGLVPALLIGGPLSDRFGRRRLVRFAMVTSVVASLTLALGVESAAFLFAGRLLAGLASGAIFAAGTAWLKELSVAPYDPSALAGRGARRASIALSAGFGIGPLIAGVISQWAPYPLVTPYAAHLVVVVFAVTLVWAVPETVPPHAARSQPRERLPPASRRRFLRAVVPLAPWVFTSASVSVAVGPALVADAVSGITVAFAGVIAGLTLGTGVLVQPLARRLDEYGDVRVVTVGLSTTVVGCLVEAGAAWTAAPWLTVLGAVLLGAGYGFCLVAGLQETQHLARPDQLGSLTAVYYALTYVGFSVPLILTGLSRFASYPTLLLAVAGFAALTLGALLLDARRNRSVETQSASPRHGSPNL